MGEKYAKKLSPWKSIREKTINVMGRDKTSYELLGIQTLDYMDLFKKFARAYGNQESYKLDHIAFIVLGDRKISYEEYGNLVNLARDNHQLFIEYNIKDTELIARLEDKLGLISLAMLTAYKAGINYSETFGTVGVWDSIIYRRLLPRNEVPPIRPDVPKLDYPGGYVKDPQVGMHDWVCSFDVNSLYPNLIVQYNMSPETIVNDKSEPHFNVENLLARSVKPSHTEYAVTANGTYFKKDELGLIPEIIRSYYDERRAVKLEMLEQQKILQDTEEGDRYFIEKKIDVLKNKQMSLKNLLNALYGAMANKYFRYFDVRIAESITLSGQLAIKWGEKAINEAMNKALGKEGGDYVVAIDTDSLYVSMTEFVNKFNPVNTIEFLDQACENHFVPVLESAHRDMFNDMNGYELRLVMAREVIADRGIWMAKKRYILNVLDDEGVRLKIPKLKIMGVDAVKSSTPMVVRDKFKEVFQVLITGTEKEAQKYISDFRNEFIKMEPMNIAFPRGCNNMEKWSDDPKKIYNKGTPIHVRGALVYNNAIRTRGLDKKYDSIGSGDKVKFLYLKVPNSVKENVIAFPDILPNELKLHEFIDFNLQFQKTFLDPVDSILKAIGWTAEEEYSLEDFFV
jgi:DNA polymerase elongation subunit (family B)